MGKATTLALLLALALPLPAAGARVVAPPGNSEADQYFETLPGSSGPRLPDATKTPASAVREGKLSAATEGALQRRGTIGKVVASVVAKTAPAGGGRAGAPSGPASEGARVPPAQGLGALFPLVLVFAAAGAVGFVLARRRPATR